MSGSANTPSGPDISAALRELLLLRAAGSISAEEFECRQAGLHAALLAGPADLPVAAGVPDAVAAPPAAPRPAPASAPQAAAAPEGAGPAPASVGRNTIIAVAVVSVLCFAGGLRWWLGDGPAPGSSTAGAPAAATPPGGPPAAPAAASGAAPQGKAGGDLTVMVKRLADKMAADPKNGDGWLLLARTYGELQQPRESAEAYAKAAALLPADAALLADWAAVNVAAHGSKWDDESRAILKRALAADGKHMKALALAGAEAFERADLPKAIEYWELLKSVAPPDSPDARLAQANLAQARTGTPDNAGKGGATPSSAPPKAPASR